MKKAIMLLMVFCCMHIQSARMSKAEMLARYAPPAPYKKCTTEIINMVKAGVPVSALPYNLESAYNINSTDAQGRTALHWAAVLGRAGMAEALLNAGADVEAEDWQGNTPLHLAVSYTTHLAERKNTIRILLEFYANIFARNYAGYRPLELAARWDYHILLINISQQVYANDYTF